MVMEMNYLRVVDCAKNPNDIFIMNSFGASTVV